LKKTEAQSVRLTERAKTAEASASGHWVWWENVRAEHTWETRHARHGGRKALKSEAQERGELKDAFEGEEADVAERVAKP
jgi:predicted small secreted protein